MPTSFLRAGILEATSGGNSFWRHTVKNQSPSKSPQPSAHSLLVRLFLPLHHESRTQGLLRRRPPVAARSNDLTANSPPLALHVRRRARTILQFLNVLSHRRRHPAFFGGESCALKEGEPCPPRSSIAGSSSLSAGDVRISWHSRDCRPAPRLQSRCPAYDILRSRP